MLSALAACWLFTQLNFESCRGFSDTYFPEKDGFGIFIAFLSLDYKQE